MTVAKMVVLAIEGFPEGLPFAVKDLLSLGRRSAVDQALYRMHRDGQVIRVARGIYARPKWNKFVKRSVMPEPFEVAMLVAKTKGEVAGPTGAEAAHRLGLTTQMPVQSIYATTGRSTKIKMGKNIIRFKHVAPSKMQYAGTPVGTAIAALQFMGKKQVTIKTIATIKLKLAPDDFNKLRHATSALAGWALDRFTAYEALSG